MAEYSWAKILNEIYSNTDEENGDSIERIHKSMEESEEEITEALRFLKKHDLIEQQGGSYLLTEKGFEVARDRNMQMSQLDTNMHLAVFTFLLTLGIIVQAVYQVQEAGILGRVIGISLVALSVVMFLLLERRTGLFRMILEGK